MPEKMKQYFDPLAGAGPMTFERLAAAWCRLTHDSAMWPVHGQYQCRSCGRRYPVPWMERAPLSAVAGTSMLVLNPGGHQS